MAPFAFTDAERYAMTEMCALALDEQGREVMVGLTLAQTAILMEHNRTWIEMRRSGKRLSDDELDRIKVYRDKHELARLAALGQRIRRPLEGDGT